MSLPTLNGIARLIEDPELRFSPSGKAVVKVRMAFNARKKDDQGNWVDGDSFFITGTAFDQAAENIAETLQRAMEVVVSGRLRTDTWETREGEKRSTPGLLIDSIGPSLRFATAKVEKAQRSNSGQPAGGAGWGGGQQGGGQRGGAAPQGDPWASQAPAGNGQQGGGWGAPADQAPPF